MNSTVQRSSHHHHHRLRRPLSPPSSKQQQQQRQLTAITVHTRIVKTSTDASFYGKVTFRCFTSTASPTPPTKGWTKITRCRRESPIELDRVCRTSWKQSKVSCVVDCQFEIECDQNRICRLSSGRGSCNARTLTASTLRHTYSVSALQRQESNSSNLVIECLTELLQVSRQESGEKCRTEIWFRTQFSHFSISLLLHFLSFFLFCVRNVLNKAKELGLQTIGICSLNIPERNYPAELAAHIALSKAHTHFVWKMAGNWSSIWTKHHSISNHLSFSFFSESIRKFLEANQREIVIFCLNQQDCGVYEVLAPLYFPRNQLEETSAVWQLPKTNYIGISGELSISDRQIRITRNPQHTIMIGSELFEKNMSKKRREIQLVVSVLPSFLPP